MEPLNKQERTEATVKVLALFVIAVILIAIPMYYAFRLPCIVSDKNSELLAKMEKMKENERQFLIYTDSAKYIYNLFEQEKNELDRTKWRLQYPPISLDMDRLTKKIAYDTLKSRLYSNVVFSFDKMFINQDSIFGLRGRITKILNPIPSGPVPPPEPEPTLRARLIKIVEEALRKNDNNKRLSGVSVGLSEKTFSQIVKELDIKPQ
jgi:hypothetical protein